MLCLPQQALRRGKQYVFPFPFGMAAFAFRAILFPLVPL